MNSENKPKTINDRELEILEFWDKEKIFEKSLFENKGNPSYNFYDGPPFATGLPHFGHLLQSYLKDSIPRYQTMKGKYVRRVWGWDTHGLPIENLIEKELGFKSKADIETFGVGKFTRAAIDSVLRFEDEWKKIIPRLGRWVDMENRYITFNNTYTESVWWSFSELYKKGLAYEGYKVMHVCPRCETPLAASEVALGYTDIKDISVYVKFKLYNDDIAEDGEEVDNEPETDDEAKGDETASLLAWTTTPWTLPGNTAIAINKNLIYQKVEFTDDKGIKQKLILAKNTAAKVLTGIEYTVDKEFLGEKLVGKKYKPVFDYYEKNTDKISLSRSKPEMGITNIWKVWHADFVTEDSGTGIAHEAPAFGEDDYNLAEQNGIPTIIHIGMDGKFYDEVTDFAGERVKWKGETQATDKKVCEFLQNQNMILKTEIISHSYPLCWRCDTPLLNYATSSWFVAVSKMREELLDANKKVYWVPDNVRDGRMGQWLEGARDWAVSRNRYWGAPLPVWKSETEVFVPGSLKELQTRTKAKNKYFLVRHGQTDSNKKSEDTENALVSGTVDVVLGQDSSLNETGVEQIKNSTAELKNKNLDAKNILILSSPYKRTLESAKIIAQGLGISEDSIVVEERLGEWQVGEENNGKSWKEFYQENEGVNYFYHKMSGAKETKIDMQNRMNLVLKELEEKYQEKNVILVTHKSPIACIISRNDAVLLEMGTNNKPEKWLNAKNGEVVELDWHPLPTDEKGEVNFHLPHIDEVEVFDQQGNKMKRGGGVFDCWYESGSMPYAQFHYPFENKELFKQNFPAEFIAEAQDQTRGWFYTMLVLGVGLFGQSPFKSVITSGMINASDGKKMSKKLKNYSDPLELVEKYGTDALRYYVLSTPVVKGETIKFSDDGVKLVYSKNIGRLLNVLSFYKMYADEKVLSESTSEHVLDKYIVSRFKQVKIEVTKGFEELFVDQAFRPIEKFIDDLSVWYLRRSRDRFKSDNETEVKKVLQTTKYILQNFAKCLAPIMPFTADMIWREVRDDVSPISVHLAQWGEVPVLDEEDIKNIENMELTREVVSAILDERIKEKIKVRQPLSSATLNSNKYDAILADENYLQEIRDEVNIREIKKGEPGGKACVLDTNITEELKVEGTYRELVRMIQDKRKEMNLKVSDTVSIVLPESLDEFSKQVVESKGEDLKKECGISGISFGAELMIK